MTEISRAPRATCGPGRDGPREWSPPWRTSRRGAGLGAVRLVLGLIGFRFLLGFGVGGDHPVSAVMVSEYANRKDRGKLVGMMFGTQASGLVVGPLIALALLGSGASNAMTWRVLLALGALPAAAVIYLRCRMPESGRYRAQVQGRAEQAASQRASAQVTAAVLLYRAVTCPPPNPSARSPVSLGGTLDRHAGCHGTGRRGPKSGGLAPALSPSARAG